MPNPHPYIIHFPIVLLICAALCEIAARIIPDRSTDQSGGVKLRSLFSHAALVTGLAAPFGAIAAVITGLLAEEIVPEVGEVHEVLESHETLGFVVLGIAVLFAAVKLWSFLKRTDRYGYILIALGIAGILAVILAAHEGGELVYEHGVGVEMQQPSVETGELGE